MAPILFGSHSDSVIAGGNFDGPLGVLAAVEAAETLIEQRVPTTHPLEVVVCNQRGGRGLRRRPLRESGCRGGHGDGRTREDLERRAEGRRDSRARRRSGRLADARRAKGSIHAYVELHIEQGSGLERAGVPIGVVQGIVAIHRYQCVVRGAANHAGTTPMADRRDALLAASKLVEAVHEVVTGLPGRQVATVGQLDVEPNAPNVIPGTVRLTVELRDSRDRCPARACRAGQGAGGSHRRGHGDDDRDRGAVELPPCGAGLAKGAGSHRGSGGAAWPDAVANAERCRPRRADRGGTGPMGIMFVPSVGGISHSPREWTSWEDCARGADVLLATVLALDGGLRSPSRRPGYDVAFRKLTVNGGCSSCAEDYRRRHPVADAAVVVAASPDVPKAASTPVAVGSVVPKDVTLTDIYGKTHSLADYRGRKVVFIHSGRSSVRQSWPSPSA